MASKDVIVSYLVTVIVTMFMTGIAAQSGCTNVIIGMSPCLNFITGNSSSPSSSCCAQLANAVQSQPQCLCSVLNGGGAAALGLVINQTLALALPGACNVQTPSAAQGPASTPSASPVDTPSDGIPAGTPVNEIPADAPTSDTPAGSRSNTVPTAGGGDQSHGNSTGYSLVNTFLLIFTVFCVAAVTSF